MILEKTQTQNPLRELSCLESDIEPDSSLILSVTKKYLRCYLSLQVLMLS
jgi:hypothetical protein